MKAALTVPINLAGNAYKIVTKDFVDKALRPLRGKQYTSQTPICIPIKDIIEALGGKYIETEQED